MADLGAPTYSQSLSVSSWGQPCIAFYDPSSQTLKYAWNDLTSINAWNFTTVDSGQQPTGTQCSLAMQPNGHPAISYRGWNVEGTRPVLKYAWYDGNYWQTTTIESTTDSVADRLVGGNTSLTFLPSGRAAIAFFTCAIVYDDSLWGPEPEPVLLKYAELIGSSWTVHTIDQVDLASWPSGYYFCSLGALDDGTSVVSYTAWVEVDWVLKFAWYATDWQTTLLSSSVGPGVNSLATQSDDPIFISYGSPVDTASSSQYPHFIPGAGSTLDYAVYQNGQWDHIILSGSDWESLVGLAGTSAAALPSGQFAMAYVIYADPAKGESDTAVKYAWQDGDSWYISRVDTSSHFTAPSLTILPSGYPAVSYVDEDNNLLKYAVMTTSSTDDHDGDDIGDDSDGDSTGSGGCGSGAPGFALLTAALLFATPLSGRKR